jgi:hypothetical protein
MKWIGPITVNAMLDRVALGGKTAPPESNGVYVISVRRWRGEPSVACGPLYVGGNTGKSARFRTRMGDLIADMFGFYGESTGHHSGGQSLNSYCRKTGTNPKDLFVGWARDCACGRCGEVDLYACLQPKLNKKRPAACKRHMSK